MTPKIKAMHIQEGAIFTEAGRNEVWEILDILPVGRALLVVASLNSRISPDPPSDCGVSIPLVLESDGTQATISFSGHELWDSCDQEENMSVRAIYERCVDQLNDLRHGIASNARELLEPDLIAAASSNEKLDQVAKMIADLGARIDKLWAGEM